MGKHKGEYLEYSVDRVLEGLVILEDENRDTVEVEAVFFEDFEKLKKGDIVYFNDALSKYCVDSDQTEQAKKNVRSREKKLFK